MSLDALRGFDMFWIIGGGAIFEALAKFTNWSLLNWWAGNCNISIGKVLISKI
jgi:hypothetical protein